LRIDAVGSGLSAVMWAVIWVGAVISIGVAYFYKIEDPKLHAILVALMGGFLAIVLFMIIINDKPFYGYVSISSDPYQLILERVIDQSR
jgi:predicted membrane channel-forming protein YqfA (hemolysin III family)